MYLILICIIIIIYIIITCNRIKEKKQLTRSLDKTALSLVVYKLHETPQAFSKTKNPALINFVYKDNIYGNDGIIEAAGELVKQEYDEKRLQDEHVPEHVSQGVIETSNGELPVSAIFHIMVSQQQGKFETAMRTTLRLAHSKRIRDTVVSAVPCAYPNNINIMERYPHLPPASRQYEEEGRLVIVPADVESVEYFRMGDNVWLVYPRSGKAKQSTQGWRADVFKDWGNRGRGIVQIGLPVVAE